MLEMAFCMGVHIVFGGQPGMFGVGSRVVVVVVVPVTTVGVPFVYTMFDEALPPPEPPPVGALVFRSGSELALAAAGEVVVKVSSEPFVLLPARSTDTTR